MARKKIHQSLRKPGLPFVESIDNYHVDTRSMQLPTKRVCVECN